MLIRFQYILVMMLAIALAAGQSGAQADKVEDLGIRLENYKYPYPVKMFHLRSQNQDLEMAYMDVPGADDDSPVVLLLHGKNFMGAYWGKTAGDLAKAGFHVIIPDQIGFGKSTKPAYYQYSFHQLAANTNALLQSLGIERADIVGHSMGGMLAARYALEFPVQTEKLVLVDPIGLEDWKRVVPYITIDEWYQKELKTDYDSIKKYQMQNYYHGTWKPEYDEWVNVMAGMAKSADYSRMAWNQALTYDMIFTQPVIYEFPNITQPTLLIIGQLDRTALGKDKVDPKIRATLGRYPILGRGAANAIPDAKLLELDGVGHLPQVEAYDRFIGPLTDFLKN